LPPHAESTQPPLDAGTVSALAAELLAAGEGRVAELKRLYERGEYTPPADAVAARIIDEHQQG
jgi:anti-sigma28 factor (negative regulator of flagellin synthesis)